MTPLEKMWPKGLAKKTPAEQLEWSIANGLALPPFLYITPEERKAAWERNPPRAAVDVTSFAEAKHKSDDAKRLAVKVAKEKKKAMKAADQPKVDMTNMRWDPRKGKFVPDLGDPAKPVTSAPPKPAAGGSVLEVDALITLVAKGNPRVEGTGAYKRYAEMMKYLKKKPKATVGEVLEKTAYRKDDYFWDLKKGNIK